MIVVAISALMIGIGVVCLVVGRSFGRWESDTYYQPIIEEQRRVIDGLLPTGVKVLE